MISTVTLIFFYHFQDIGAGFLFVPLVSILETISIGKALGENKLIKTLGEQIIWIHRTLETNLDKL